jgi:hypothetical protein
MHHPHRQPLTASKPLLAATMILAGLLTGCVSEQAPESLPPRQIQVPAAPSRQAQAQPASPAQPAEPAQPAQPHSTVDACSENLHELAGYLLEYYAIHHQEPASLDQLAPLAGHPILVTCPVSKLPYVYVPQGLSIPGEANQLILYDPEPSHAGHRWAIFTRPAQGAAPVGLWVSQISEASLRKYQASQQNAPASE